MPPPRRSRRVHQEGVIPREAVRRREEVPSCRGGAAERVREPPRSVTPPPSPSPLRIPPSRAAPLTLPPPRPAAVFIGAVLAGNLAHLTPSTLNAFVGFYLASRVAYNLFYIHVTSRALSFLRSASFLAGVVSLMVVFVKSGNAVNKF